jgi:DNA-binding transcriptional ArsR family regulator
MLFSLEDPVPHRLRLAQKQLAELFACLGHPLRLGILFELEHGERDVTSLQNALVAPQSLVSQNLAKLRAARLVQERREGRHVFYRLSLSSLPQWLADGYKHLEAESADIVTLRDAIETVSRARDAVELKRQVNE